MYIVDEVPEKRGVFDNAGRPLFLWIEQNLRRIRGKPLLQEDVLARVVAELKTDPNLLGILLFGSLASGTQTWKSDIDLIFVYEKHEPPSGLVNRWQDGIEVQYFFTTLATLIENEGAVPYLLHMFCDGQLLLDRYGSVGSVVARLKEYFAVHPEIAAEWVGLKELHQVEKTGPACQQTTIIQRWDEMEAKYGDGKRKRTFFIM